MAELDFQEILRKWDEIGVPTTYTDKRKPKKAHIQNGPVHKLTIHYTNGSSWTVKNARDIVLFRNKSGGYDVRYKYQKTKGEETLFGKQIVYSDIQVETDTGDVSGITVETRKDKEFYKKESVFV